MDSSEFVESRAKELLGALRNPDDKAAYAFVKQLAAASEQSPELYPYLETFAGLLKDEKSYMQVRACVLCCSQARWDAEGRLAAVLPDIFALLQHPKPTVVRQCLSALREVAVFRPELRGAIRDALTTVDPGAYKDSMAPLIAKDAAALAELMAELMAEAY